MFGAGFPPLHLASLLKARRMGAWLRAIAELSEAGRYNLWQLLWVYSRGDVLNALQYMAPRTPTWLAADMRTAVDEAQRTLITATCGRFLSNIRAFHYYVIATLAASLPDHDRFLFEPRSPLLSLPLVEFMIAIPWNCKITANSTRVLQRRAFGNILPKAILHRTTKASFTARFFSALRRRWDFWEPLAKGTYLADLGLVNSAEFRRSCEALRQGIATDSIGSQCAALILEQWLRMRRIRTDDPSLRRFRHDAACHR